MLGLLLGCPVFSSLAKHSANPFRLIAVGLWIRGRVDAGVRGGAVVRVFVPREVRRRRRRGELLRLSRAVHRRRRAQSEENQVARGVLPVHPGRRRVGVHLRRVGRRELGVALGLRDRERRHGARRRLLLRVRPRASQRSGGRRRGAAAGGRRGKPSTRTRRGFRAAPPSSPRGERSGPPRRRRGVAFAAFAASFRGFARDVLDLARVPAYVTVLVGYVFYTAVVGVYAVWGPKAAFGVFGGAAEGGLERPSEADFALGVVTVVAGVFERSSAASRWITSRGNTRRRRAFESPRASAPFRR